MGWILTQVSIVVVLQMLFLQAVTDKCIPLVRASTPMHWEDSGGRWRQTERERERERERDGMTITEREREKVQA